MLDWATIVAGNVRRHWCRRCHLYYCCCHLLCHYYCCHLLLPPLLHCSDSNCSTMTTNSMQTNAKMLQHLDQVNRPMCPGPVRLDTNDMVMVFVVQRLPLDDSIDRLQMVALLAVLGQMRPLLLHTAMRQCTVDHRTIFGMQHNYLLRPIAPNRRPFDVSILFYKNERGREGERKNERIELKWCNFTKQSMQVIANGAQKFSVVYSMGWRARAIKRNARRKLPMCMIAASDVPNHDHIHCRCINNGVEMAFSYAHTDNGGTRGELRRLHISLAHTNAKAFI